MLQIQYGYKIEKFRIYCSESGLIRNIKVDYTNTKKEIEDFICLRDTEIRPTIKNYCKICQHYSNCVDYLKKSDDISLLSTLNQGEIKSLHKRGITTINQLSYRLRPSKLKANRMLNKYPSEIKALAIRENKTLFFNTGKFELAHKKIYLDFEVIPNSKIIYLCGLLIDDSSDIKYEYYWLDKCINQQEFLLSILDRILELRDYTIYHYGNLDKQIFKDFLVSENLKTKYSELLVKFGDIYLIIHKRIFFPTYSNSLKDITDFLGFRSNCCLTNGYESIYWRMYWSVSNNEKFKSDLINYNRDDCNRLKVLSNFINKMDTHDNLSEIVKSSSSEKWFSQDFTLESFRKINSYGYFDYQRQKVYIKTNPQKAKDHKKNHKTKKTNTKLIEVAHPKYCPICGGLDINRHQIYTKELIDLVDSVNGFKAFKIKYITGRYKCHSCGTVFTPSEHRVTNEFGFTLKAWIVNSVINYKVRVSSIPKILNDLFGVNISTTGVSMIKHEFALFYKVAFKTIQDELMNSSLVQIDETKVRLRKKSGYVFTLTNMTSTIYLFRNNRETSFLEDILMNFKGVLITDYYSGYDKFSCLKQKCLIHLLRDLNDILVRYPFDKEIKWLCHNFGEILNTIVSKINRYGLKKHYLKKYSRKIDAFFSELKSIDSSNEAFIKIKKRILKYRDELFLFINIDGIPWNNNNAEFAIKQFAVYRNYLNGLLTENGLEAYLVLISIFSTCSLRKINFFDFLLSKESIINDYVKE